MNTTKKKNYKKRSITVLMFWISFSTIVFVLLIGFLTIGMISPRLYSNSVMNEIKGNLIATINYYDIDLKELYPTPLNEKEDYLTVDTPTKGEGHEAIADEEKIEQAVNISYLLSSLTISHGAYIEITDADNNLIYHTPKWYQENIRSVRLHNNPPEFVKRNPFLGNFVEDNNWIIRTTVLPLEEDYTLKVKLNLSAFNQNIMMFHRLFIYMTAVGALVALLFSIILSFIVTKPLKELKTIAAAMENMDFSVRYDKNRNDEIGQLGHTLNHMMDRLGTNIHKLEAELQKEKRTDKLRREFVAQVSHELKTPIAIVSNYTEALLDGVADNKEEQRSYLNTIENECRKMSHIINDLLDLAQMEAGTFAIHKSEFKFSDLLTDLTSRYSALMIGEVRFITDIKAEDAAMHGDELRIEQAVSNLLSNAIKHTAKDGFIKLSAAKEGSMVHIQVENSGSPIDKDLIPRIWDSFAKGTDEKGTGLGLSITKNIVELHKGEYYVRCLDGSVVFGIRLPVSL